MTQEAMKQALEALDIAQGMLAVLRSHHQPKMLSAYTALREALAQTQEPVQYKCTVIDDVHPNGIPLEQWAKPPQRTEQEPVFMRMPIVGDKIICIEDDSLGTVAYLTAGGSPEIRFDDGSHGTYLLREFAKLFRYADITPPQPEQEPVAHLWECIGRWSAYLVNNGKQADCAPPSWLVDAVNNATTPPQRTWVDLTDDEIQAIAKQARSKDHAVTLTNKFLRDKNT